MNSCTGQLGVLKEVTDKINLNAALGNVAGYHELSLSCELKVNDVFLHPELSVDLRALAKSSQCSGEFDIFTCGCGIAGCAGIFEGIRVEHLPEAVVWDFKEPLSERGYFHLSDDDWAGIRKPVRLSFDPDEYQQNIGIGIRKIKAMVLETDRPVSLGISHFGKNELMALEMEVFSSRLDVPEKHLIAKQVEIDAYNDLIMAGGNYYWLDQLHLPEELHATYLTWKSFAVFPNGEEDLPAYLEYLQQGRKFCVELRKYLRSQAVVRFKYHPPKVYNSVAWEIIEEIR